MIRPDNWKEGRAEAWIKKIPEEDACERCSGSGETDVLHSFLYGYRHIPCYVCAGTGLKDPKLIDKFPYKYEIGG